MPFNTKTFTSHLDKAISIAVKAHEGQVDKGGAPYILHPLRVMLSVNTEDERIVAVLHDVIEDCSDRGFTFEYLSDQGFSEIVVDAIKSVTKTYEEELNIKSKQGQERIDAYLKFVERAKNNSIGRVVKKADITDNMDTSRLGELNHKDIDRLTQYKAALDLLS